MKSTTTTELRTKQMKSTTTTELTSPAQNDSDAELLLELDAELADAELKGLSGGLGQFRIKVVPREGFYIEGYGYI